jgi:hypothetical protein
VPKSQSSNAIAPILKSLSWASSFWPQALALYRFNSITAPSIDRMGRVVTPSSTSKTRYRRWARLSPIGCGSFTYKPNMAYRPLAPTNADPDLSGPSDTDNCERGSPEWSSPGLLARAHPPSLPVRSGRAGGPNARRLGPITLIQIKAAALNDAYTVLLYRMT